VVYEIDDAASAVTIYKVGHRKDVYKSDLPRARRCCA
jgi:mRNA-degrading endonuclease RelE of RelBE toxin-antitoxin system